MMLRRSPDPDDIAHCADLLRAGSRSFHAASLLLPRRIRPDVTALYAFCRVADDAIDEVEDKAAALIALTARLDRVYADRPDDDPVDRAFTWLVQRHRIPRALPDALLEGFAWDADRRRYASLSGVRAYSVRVASVVGVMMTLIMGVRRPDALARACDLGVAMQLTNISRDVGEDAREGRLYLPTGWFEELGVDVEAWMRDPVASPPIRLMVERLLSEADHLYRRADTGIPMLPWPSRFAIRAARLIYSDIGVVLRGRHRLNSVSHRAITSTTRKLGRLAQTIWELDALRSRNHPTEQATAPALPEAQHLIHAIHED